MDDLWSLEHAGMLISLWPEVLDPDEWLSLMNYNATLDRTSRSF